MTRHLAPTPGQPDRAATHRAEVDTYRAAAVLRARIADGSPEARGAADGLLAAGRITALDPPAPAGPERGSWWDSWWPALVLAAVAVASLGWIGWWAL